MKKNIFASLCSLILLLGVGITPASVEAQEYNHTLVVDINPEKTGRESVDTIINEIRIVGCIGTEGSCLATVVIEAPFIYPW